MSTDYFIDYACLKKQMCFFSSRLFYSLFWQQCCLALLLLLLLFHGEPYFNVASRSKRGREELRLNFEFEAPSGGVGEIASLEMKIEGWQALFTCITTTARLLESEHSNSWEEIGGEWRPLKVQYSNKGWVQNWISWLESISSFRGWENNDIPMVKCCPSWNTCRDMALQTFAWWIPKLRKASSIANFLTFLFCDELKLFKVLFS